MEKKEKKEKNKNQPVENDQEIETKMENGMKTEAEAEAKTETETETKTGMAHGDDGSHGTGKTPEEGGSGQESGRSKTNVRRLISNLLIVAGLLLILVPLVISYLNTRRNENIIDQFLADAQMAALDSEWIVEESIEPVFPAQSTPTASSEATPAAPANSPSGSVEPSYPPEASQAQTATPEPPSPTPTKKPTMSAEEIQKRMTGVILIDKIDLRMVIMDGVDDETLRVAAGRMPGTGNFDEVGNVVLAGHRSYTFGKYFNRLDELVEGDEIIVQTRTKKLKYIVYDKLVIEPDDLSILKGNGKDKILTLFTCTPVVIADHRLVIHAKQVE